MQKRALLIVNLKDNKQVHSLDKPMVVIGRGGAAPPDIIISDQTISRVHARVAYNNGHYILEDLSTYGRTFVNMAHITGPTIVNHHDILQFGSVRCDFMIQEEGAPEQDLLYQDPDTAARGISLHGVPLPEFPMDMPTVMGSKPAPLGTTVKPAPSVTAVKPVPLGTTVKPAPTVAAVKPAPTVMADPPLTAREIAQSDSSATPLNNLRVSPVEEATSPPLEAADNANFDQFLEGDLAGVEEARLESGEAQVLPESDRPLGPTDQSKWAAIAQPAQELRHLAGAELICLTDGRILPIEKEVFYVGANSQNDLCLTAPYFAKVQFAVIKNPTAGLLFVKHLGKNETRLNGIPVDKIQPMENGALLSVGAHRFCVFDGHQNAQDPLYLAVKSGRQKSSQNCASLRRAARQNLVWNWVFFPQDRSAGEFFFVQEKSDCLWFCVGEIRGAKDQRERLAGQIEGSFAMATGLVDELAKIVEEMHRCLSSTLESCEVSLTVMRSDSSMNLQWCIAGAPPMVLVRGNRTVELLPANNSLFGLAPVYQARSSEFRQGDSLLLFNTTLTQVQIPGEDQERMVVGIEDLKRLFLEHEPSQAEPQQLTERMMAALREQIITEENCLLAVLQRRKD